MAPERLSRLQRRILAWLVAEDARLWGTMAAEHQALVRALASPALAGSTMRCQTHDEPTLNRYDTLCNEAQTQQGCHQGQ
jgi:hypothetical protein